MIHDAFTNYNDPEILFHIQYVPIFQKDAGYSSEELCRQNARMILNAIEAYDMEHNASMDELDMDLLYKDKYLSENSLKSVKDVKSVIILIVLLVMGAIILFHALCTVLNTRKKKQEKLIIQRKRK